MFYCFVKFCLQNFSWRQFCQILGHPDTALFKLQQFHGFMLFTGAQNQANRCILFFLSLILVQPAQVKLHLSFISRLEVAYLKVYGKQPSKPAIVKEQVYVIVVIVNLYPFLARNE